MTDYEKTEMATGNSNGAFRFFSVFLGFSRFSGKGTLGGVGVGEWAKRRIGEGDDTRGKPKTYK
jgi:hypothetical protein